MNGKGTIDEPYIIEDVYDFCAIADDEDKEVTYYKLDTNIDFNDHEIYKQGFKGGAVVNADKSVLDGNGKEIRNIVAYNATGAGDVLFTFREINNCKFANVASLLTSRPLFKSEFKRCSFYIMIYNASFNYLFKGDSSGHCTFYECALTFSGSSLETMSFGTNKYERCRIIFKDFTAPSYATTGSGAYAFVINYGDFDHSYFTGELNLIRNDTRSVNYIFINGSFINVYFAVKFDISGGTGNTYNLSFSRTAPAASCFFDKDLISNSVCNSSSNAFALSTEECKSTSELIKIGFPVISRSW